jgi:hypothetical protein
MPENYAPSGDYYPISPVEQHQVATYDINNLPHAFANASRSFGSSLVGETFGVVL